MPAPATGEIRAYPIDLEGTLHVGGEPIPGAVAVVHRLRARAVPLRVITNTTTRSTAGLLDLVRNLGPRIEERELFSVVIGDTGAYVVGL